MALTTSVELEVGLATRRLRRAVATSAVGLAARAVGIAGNLLLVPLTIGFLGQQRYGIWATLLSLVTLISLSDLGIGNALVSRIAVADAQGKSTDAARYLATALLVFSIIATALAVAFVAAYSFIPWSELFNLRPGAETVNEARLAAAVLVGLLLVRVPLDVVVNVRRGLQEGYINAWFEMLSGVLKVALVALVVYLELGLPWLVAAATAGLVVSSFLNWVLIVHARPEFRPRPRAADRATAAVLLRGGGLFFALQLASIVAFSSDNFVAAQVLGPAAVTQYAVPSQISLSVIGAIGLLSAPLWPAYAEAMARGDHPWIMRALVRSLLICAGVGAGSSLFLLVFGRRLIDIWSRGEVVPSYTLLAGLCAWIVLASTGSAAAMLMNAANIVRFQVICASLMAASNIFLSVFLARRIGVAGLIWGTVISYVIFVVVPYSVYLIRWHRAVTG